MSRLVGLFRVFQNVVSHPLLPGMAWHFPELRSWHGKLDQSLDRQRVGKATPGKFCTRWLQARRARSDAPYQRWARDRAWRGIDGWVGLMDGEMGGLPRIAERERLGSWFGTQTLSSHRNRVLPIFSTLIYLDLP